MLQMILTLLLISGGYFELLAQTVIWQENFNSYQDGTTIGANHNVVNPAADWNTGDCTACIDTADWWEIRSGRLEARDVNQLVYVQTEQIDISSFTNVQFNLEIIETGDHEGPYFGLDSCPDQEKEDYVNVLYRIDGGPWELVRNYLKWCGLYDSCSSHTLYGDDGVNSGDCRDHDDDWQAAMINVSGLTGGTLEIRIEMINSATDEFIRLDNLNVEGSIILPVTLKTFNVTATGNLVQLYWQTVSETNNDYFIIERSKNPGLNFWEALQHVTGAGFSSNIINYYYDDLFPHTGISYYRLRQVDLDGNHHYSPIVSVNVPATDNSYPYPNPTSDYINIPNKNRLIDFSGITLYDKTAKELCVPISQDQFAIRLDLKNLPNGSYILKLEDIRHRVLVSR